MIAKAKITELSIVGCDLLSEFNDSGFVLVVGVGFDEAFVQFDDLAEGEVLSWRFV